MPKKESAQVELDYKKLARAIVAEMSERGFVFAASSAGKKAVQTRKGIATIKFDDCEHIEFAIAGLASNERIRFEKDGHDSWVETVKNSHRNKSRICVTYDEHDEEISEHGDDIFIVYPPSDLHDE